MFAAAQRLEGEACARAVVEHAQDGRLVRMDEGEIEGEDVAVWHRRGRPVLDERDTRLRNYYEAERRHPATGPGTMKEWVGYLHTLDEKLRQRDLAETERPRAEAERRRVEQERGAADRERELEWQRMIQECGGECFDMSRW